MTTTYKPPRGTPDTLRGIHWTGHPDRIRRVAWAIEEAGKKHFDMDSWYSYDRYSSGGRSELDLVLDKDAFDHCGTTACIAGWAAHVHRHPARRKKIMASLSRRGSHVSSGKNIQSYARLALGMDDATSHALFHMVDMSWATTIKVLLWIADECEANQ